MKIDKVQGQMKIQQMTFMILAVFLLFIFVALFFINFQFGSIKQGFEDLAREEAISSLSVLADIPELNCDSKRRLCVDEDKLIIMSGSFGNQYQDFWPVSSIEVYKVYPAFDSEVKCPGLGCNYFKVFDSGQEKIEKVSTYVSLCKKLGRDSFIFETCEIAKLVVGMRIIE